MDFSFGKQAGKNPRFSRQLFDQNPLREISALISELSFVGNAVGSGGVTCNFACPLFRCSQELFFLAVCASCLAKHTVPVGTTLFQGRSNNVVP